jgi:glycosyltransferase involved in cell wall biosynthesis
VYDRRLNQISSPKIAKADWPWTEQSAPIFKPMPDGQPWPKISIVTPSYNQGQFIEETILSVLSQGYPNLEYIIIDGGSNDESVEIIKQYEQKLAYWVSEKDKGQAHAINKGFYIASGDILCWLNSDDMLLPGTLFYVAKKMAISYPMLLFGNCFHMKEGEAQSWGSNVKETAKKYDLKLVDYIIQPSSFWNRKAWTVAGLLDTELHYGFDWDWFIRAQESGIQMLPTDRFLSIYRIHSNHKTSTGGQERKNELLNIYRKYLGEDFVRLVGTLGRNITEIRAIQKWVRRIGLSRFENNILKITFPSIYKKLTPSMIEGILTMFY